jgi:hypothetical protein
MNKVPWIALAIVTGFLGQPSLAAELDVPVFMWAKGDQDICSPATVRGSAAVRAGPGSGHRAIDEIGAGESVWIFDDNKGWFGVVYGVERVDCAPVDNDRPYDGPGKSGWVNSEFIESR